MATRLPVSERLSAYTMEATKVDGRPGWILRYRDEVLGEFTSRSALLMRASGHAAMLRGCPVIVEHRRWEFVWTESIGTRCGHFEGHEADAVAFCEAQKGEVIHVDYGQSQIWFSARVCL